MEPPLSLLYVRPPYTEPEPLRAFGDARLDRPALGAVVAAELQAPVAALARLAGRIEVLRLRCPSVPLVLCVPTLDACEALELAMRARALHLDAILVGAAPTETSLRSALTTPLDLGADVVGWLHRRGLRLSAELDQLVATLFRRAPAFDRLAPLIRSTQSSARTARARCRKIGSVSPRGWFQLARATHAALRLQGDPRCSLTHAALELGYHDQSGLIHQFHRQFGLQPHQVRSILGWECLLARWYDRSSERATRAAPCRQRQLLPI